MYKYIKSKEHSNFSAFKSAVFIKFTFIYTIDSHSIKSDPRIHFRKMFSFEDSILMSKSHFKLKPFYILYIYAD